MLRHLLLALLMALTCFGMATETLFAPGLKAAEGTTSHMGFVNPHDTQETLTLTAYDQDGQSLGTLSMTLPPRGRFEVSAQELVAQTTPAWIRVDSERSIVGYVRQERSSDSGRATFPMVHNAAGTLFLPTLPENGSDTHLTVHNISEQEGSATLSPVRYYPYTVNYQHLEEPASIQDFGAPYQSKNFDYTSVINAGREGILWDTLDSNLMLLGVQSFQQNKRFDTLITPNIATRQLDLVPSPDRDIVNRLVLVNTTDDILRASLIVHDKYLDPSMIDLELEPFEKRTLQFGDRNSVPQFMPAWWQLESNGTGLVAYISHEGKNGSHLATTAGLRNPGQTLVLPIVDANTEIALINAADDIGSAHIHAFDDDGQVKGYAFVHPFKANEMKNLDLKDLFGNDTAGISWLRIRGQRTPLTATAFYRQSGGDLATLQATPINYRWDRRQVANFEFTRALALEPQGWQPIQFVNNDLSWINTIQFDDGCEDPHPSSFFLEVQMEAGDGLAGLGYEPRNHFNAEPEPAIQSVGLASPVFEVPPYAAGYLTFDIRWINPEFATPDDRYGVAWRVEGGEWQWYGVFGEDLLRSNGPLQDCWERVCYRNNHTEVTLTPWFALSMPLPTEVLGKRIQVGLFYEHQHLTGVGRSGPLLFIDNIAVSSELSGHTLYFDDTPGPINPPVEQAEVTEEAP